MLDMSDDDLLGNLGRSVRRLRAERDLTLKDLAARSGLSTRFLVQVESGRGNISVLKLSSLARALGSTPAQILAPSQARGGTRVVALLGLRGAGKSTIGRRLARRLARPFVELDHLVEKAAGLSLAEIFAVHGEAYYRRLERETLERLLDDGRPLVLATGGGIVAAPETFALLRERAHTVWLHARPEDHWSRVVQQGDRRPMADHPQAMAELRRILTAREPLYALADQTVRTSQLGIEKTVAAIAARARSEGGGVTGRAKRR
jgi:XRE family aerobic/anaerobic benzoate catabolism transcriptional regulator